MKTRSMYIIIKRWATAAALAALLSGMALAHGALEHVMGTVASVSDSSITVTTTAGKSVEVMLDGKTKYTRANQAMQRSELKPGDRVVIHAEKEGVKLTAETVQIGAAASSKTAAKH